MAITIRSIAAVAFALVLGTLPARAQRAPAGGTPSIAVVALNTTAAAEVAAKARAVARTTVMPGDVLRYTLTFTNSAAAPVRNVELRDPLPSGVRFVAGSAKASRADARLEFSLDGGRTWAAQPMESVQVEGRTVSQPASTDRYTHVRWVVTGAVPAGQTVTAEFAARVAVTGA